MFCFSVGLKRVCCLWLRPWAVVDRVQSVQNMEGVEILDNFGKKVKSQMGVKGRGVFSDQEMYRLRNIRELNDGDE